MIPYIIFFVIVFALNRKITKNVKKYDACDFFLLLIMIIFSAIRVGIGTDYELYRDIFRHVDNLSEMGTNRTGLGFSILMHVIKNLFEGDFQIVIIITSILTNLLMYNFYKRNSKRPRLAIFIYIALGFYTLSFNMFRQMFCIAFILNGLDYWKNKKYISSILLLVVGISFHITSILIICLIIFIDLQKKEIKPKYIFIPAIMGLLIYDMFFDIVISNIDSLAIYAYTDEYKPGMGTFINVIVYVFLYFMFIYNCRNNFDNSHKNISYKNYCLVGIGIMLFSLKNFLVVRFATYLLVFFPILMTESFEIYKFDKNKENSFVFYGCLFIYYLVYVYSFNEVVPYQSIVGELLF